MDLRIKNRIALVAASSKGLGKAAALSLANEGVHLAICSRNERSINAAADDIRNATGGKVFAIAGDVSRSEDIESIVNAVLAEYGRIDILVNNAGGPPVGKITSLPDGEWENGFNLTLMSMLRLTRAVLPLMEKQMWGRVISIVSLAAKQPIDDLLISSTLRPGILGLSKVLANQYGRFNITVNTVCPGYILTQRLEDLSRTRSAEKNISMDEYITESAKSIPLGRLGKPEELGDVVAFLASGRAAYINGANIIVDGGQAKGIF